MTEPAISPSEVQTTLALEALGLCMLHTLETLLPVAPVLATMRGAAEAQFGRLRTSGDDQAERMIAAFLSTLDDLSQAR
jgi:hypothetical protein